MKNLIVLIIILLSMGCSKDNNEPSASIVSVGVEFSILNKEGKDLLNPNTTNHYSIDSMKLYYLINDQIVEVLDTNMQYPRNIMLITENNPYRIRCFTNDDENNGLISEKDEIKIGVSIAYLELNNTDIDTIKTEWESGDNYFINKKVWYNGVLQEHPDYTLTIIKDK